MIVIDASALVRYVLREEGWEDVGSCVRRMKPLYSLDHVLKEVGNAIWKHCHLRKAISRSDALELYRAVLKLVEKGVVILEPESRYLLPALEIALRHGVTLYDALYVAQARELGELLTCDRRQAEVAIELGVKVHFIP